MNFLIVMALLSALSTPAGESGQLLLDQSREPASQTASTPQQGGIKIEIATVASFLGPPTSRFAIGGQIPVTITMTNTSPAPLNVCISSDLYQDFPKLTKDGELVPFMKWQSYERLNAQRNHVCEDENLPEPVLLKPNEPKAADWFVLVDSRTATGAEAWYDPLSPGKYELSIQRRLGCCDGPMVESNKISFEVVP